MREDSVVYPVSRPLEEGPTKTNVKPYSGAGRKAPPPPPPRKSTAGGKRKISLVVTVCIALAIVLSSCMKTPPPHDIPEDATAISSRAYYGLGAVEYYASGMHYKVFSSARGDVFVINITKDSLEVVKLINGKG